jgi:hypothetical protein
MLACSVWLNVAALVAVAGGYLYYRFERSNWEMEVWEWGVYAGSMQADADYDHGIRRIYRLIPVTTSEERGSFTGETESGAEVWTRVYYPVLGEASRLGAESFVNAYNRHMRFCLKEGRAAASGPVD